MSLKKQRAKVLLLCSVLLLLVGLLPVHSYAEGDPTVAETIGKSPSSIQPSKQEVEAPSGGVVTFQGGNSPSIWGYLLQVVFALGLVLVLIYVVFRFLSKRQLGGLRQNGPFKIVGGVPLGNGKSLQVIQVGDSLYVLGVGENIQLLRHIPAGDEMDVLLSDVEMKSSLDLHLGGWLNLRRSEKQEEQLFESKEQTGSFEELLEKQWVEVNHPVSKQGNQPDVRNRGDHS